MSGAGLSRSGTDRLRHADAQTHATRAHRTAEHLEHAVDSLTERFEAWLCEAIANS